MFFFYPLDFTFVCPTEILAFNDRVEEFRKLGAEVRAESEGTHPIQFKNPNFLRRILFDNVYPGGCLLG